MTFADKALVFLKNLRIETSMPKEVEVMNPYQEDHVLQICERFYKKFYDDNEERLMILGINPGRYGGGVTGIPFTDPIKLAGLGIDNDLPKKRELSADFIHLMIEACGGPNSFYRKFYISAVSPLGFTKRGKNLNYYDARGLPDVLESFMIKCLQEQLSWGISREVCFCLGERENFEFLQGLNAKTGFFKTIVPLPHPRFILQYRRKSLDDFIEMYKSKLFPAADQ